VTSLSPPIMIPKHTCCGIQDNYQSEE
jgi:hypothetical protein